MREILFRARTVSESEYLDDGEWIEGFYTCFNGEEHRIYTGYSETDCGDHYPDWFTVLPETVGQYTGLTDKNGKKIFEGDICRFREWANGDMCWVGRVHYEHQQFVISGGENKECPTAFLLVMSRFISENIEVIGNIHDHPELMKGGEG